MKRMFVLMATVAMVATPVLASARAGGSFSGSHVTPSISSSRSYSAPSRSYSYSSVGSKGSNTYNSSQTYAPITKSETAPVPKFTSAQVNRAPVAPALSPVYTSGSNINSHSGSSFGSTALAAGVGSFGGTILGNAFSGNHGGTTVVNNGGGGYAPAGIGYGGAPVAEGGYAAPMYNTGSGFWSVLFSFVMTIGVICFILYVTYSFWKKRNMNLETEFYHDVTRNIQPTKVSSLDKSIFIDRLISIQTAWSNRDKLKLRSLMSDELYEHFVSIMNANTVKGVINKVDKIAGIECDVLESWCEGNTNYATCIMRWSAHDYTTDIEGNVIDDGATDYVKETWTFVRDSFDTKWRLSAVQQMD